MARILCWLGVLVALLGCAAAVPVPSSTGTPAAFAPNFTLRTLDGQYLSLSELHGRYVLLNFWATWCAPCRDEMPFLQSFATAHAAQVTVLAINQREDAATVAQFARQHRLSFPILLDPTDDMLRAYQVQALPLTVLVAPQGTIIYRQFGPLAPDSFLAWWQQHVP